MRRCCHPLLAAGIKSGAVDTVVLCFPDMYGRLMGKRLDASHYLSHIDTHACDYLLACDMNMTPVPGYSFASFEQGYGDVELQTTSDNTPVIASWADKHAYVIADVYSQKTNQLASVAPRSLLKNILGKYPEYGVTAASELEYFTYKNSYEEARHSGYGQQEMEGISQVIQDYHVLQGHREEHVTGLARRMLKSSGIPVEGTKGEAACGQHELNYSHSDVLLNCDRHLIVKQCLKDIAHDTQHSVSFMAKPYSDVTGSGCHLHLNLTVKE